MWCRKIKELLDENDREYKVHEPPRSELKMFAEIFDFNTVPQVFYKGTRIGGYEDTKKFLED